MTQADGKEPLERPVEGKLKVNTDAAIFSDSNRYSYSCMARDHKGESMGARDQLACLDTSRVQVTVCKMKGYYIHNIMN